MKIKIENKKFIFKPEGNLPRSKSHAQVPFVFPLDSGDLRIYFSTRDDRSRSSVSYVELNKDDLGVKYIHQDSCIMHGTGGTFDDSGVMPSWFLKSEDKIRLYYTAWNRSESASYRLSIGVAESKDGGITFQKLFTGPILDRFIHDPIWVGQPCVMKDGNTWKMWYLSCQKIEDIDGIPEPFYNVRYAESMDGIYWERLEKNCIDFDSNTDAIGRPCVWKYASKYWMLHSNRKALGYRTQKESAYRIELSVSDDGINWQSVPEFKFEKSETGWDNVMNEYTTVHELGNGEFLVFYNGNGFGASGFGVAKMTIEL